MCELFVISVVCLLFRYRHLATHLVHTHPECSQQWQVRWTSLSVCVRVCIFTLIDYRCTAGLVGCSRQWKWAWPPLRKRDSSHRPLHTVATDTGTVWLAREKKALTRKTLKHILHTHTHLRTIRHTTHLLGFQMKLSSILALTEDKRGRRRKTGRRGGTRERDGKVEEKRGGG